MCFKISYDEKNVKVVINLGLYINQSFINISPVPKNTPTIFLILHQFISTYYLFVEKN